MKRRGVVLELGTGYAIVLTPDGDFCRIPRAGDMAIGMEVPFDTEILRTSTTSSEWRRRSRRFSSWRKAATGIAAAIVVGAGIWTYNGVMHPQTAEAYAWVSLDVNPSVSLKVDKNLKVTDATGTDSDGKALVSALKLKGLSLTQAANQVLSYANTHHFLTSQAGILVAVTAIQKNTSASNVSKAAQDAVNKAIASNQSVLSMHPAVYAVTVPMPIWQAASDAHISPGRLMSVLVAAQEGQKAGLLDVQGSELASVWSNPQAKEAATKIDSNDPSQLERVLQSLSDLGPQASGNNASGSTPSSSVNSNGVNPSNSTGAWNAASANNQSRGSSSAGQNASGNRGQGAGDQSGDNGVSNTQGSGSGQPDNQPQGQQTGQQNGTSGQGQNSSQNNKSSGGANSSNGKPGSSSQSSPANKGDVAKGKDSRGQNGSQGTSEKHGNNNQGNKNQGNNQNNSAGKSSKGSTHRWLQGFWNNATGNQGQDGQSQQKGKDSGRNNHDRRGNSQQAKNDKGNSNGNQGSDGNTVTIHIGNRTFTIPLKVPDGQSSSQNDGN